MQDPQLCDFIDASRYLKVQKSYFSISYISLIIYVVQVYILQRKGRG